MRVAFDAGPTLDAPTGVGRYANELARALELQGVDLVRYAVSWRGGRKHGIKRWRVPARTVQWSWRRFSGPALERLVGPVDVVHATNFVLPAVRSTKGVLTIHDLSFYRSDAFPGAERLRDLVPWSVARAQRVLVPTNAIAREVVERLGVPEEIVAVTYEGVSPLFFGTTALSETALASFGIRRPFVVAVGTIEPRKNLPTLLEAWDAARKTLTGWTLVLAGPRGWGPELRETAGVVPIGWVGDETLPGILAAADLFCYPSLYEGFGLPPLEAMAAGTAAIVARYSAAEEVLGDAAWLFDPLDVEGLVHALTSLAEDAGLRRSYAMAGRAHATGYTWERTAAATMSAYRAI